jgi:uncharacterized protein YjbJ (UPF0337 family)
MKHSSLCDECRFRLFNSLNGSTVFGQTVHGPIDRIIVVRPRCPDCHDKISRRFAMNQDTIKGQWKQISGKIKQQWGKLTDDDMQVVEGNVEMLAGRLQERYGIARDEAEREVRAFEENLEMSRSTPPHLKH